jgi:hypothetical protein
MIASIFFIGFYVIAPRTGSCQPAIALPGLSNADAKRGLIQKMAGFAGKNGEK